MRLTQLKLAGFKSFAEPTTIPTPAQRVGVVGPNGCGKSNIIDAVRWVLGESRASELRAESMQEVIFNGSGQRQPAARAAVELVFDNSSSRASGQWAPYSEISVRRVVTRDGNSNYFINNQAVRRRDVHDMFLGTGLGARGYAIIGQGMINRIIEARPQELRTYLEEAAGISRYKERRRETENRLQDTRTNLTRVQDILRELRQQLNRLHGQAERAQRYRDWQSEAQTKRHLLWTLHERQAQQERQTYSEQIESQQTQLEAKLADLRAHERTLEDLRQQHEDSSQALHQAQGDLYASGAEVSRIEAEIEHLRDNRRRAQQRHDDLCAQQDQWEQEQAQAGALFKTHAFELEIASARLEEAHERCALAQDGLPRLEEAAECARRLYADCSQTQHRHERALALAEQSLQDIQRRQDSLGQRESRLTHECTTLPRTDSLVLKNLEAHHADCVLEQQRLCAVRDALERQLDECAAHRDACERQWHKAREELAQGQAEHDALSALQASVQQQGALPAWLKRHGLASTQALWQLLTVDAGWEQALEAVLHERLAALPVPDLDVLNALIHDAPPASQTVYQLDHTQETPMGQLPGARPLLDLVHVHEVSLRPLLTDWLSGVFCGEDWSHALSHQRLLLPGQCLILPDGHRLDRHSVRFYVADTEQAGVLARQQAMTRLESVLSVAHRKTDECNVLRTNAESAHKEVLKQLQEARTQLSDATNDAHRSELAWRQAQQAAQLSEERNKHLAQELTELAEQKSELAAETFDLEERLRSTRADLSLVQEQLAQALKRSQEAEAALDSGRKALAEQERQEQAAQYELQSLKSRQEELQRQQNQAITQVAQIKKALDEVGQELSFLDEAEIQERFQTALAQRLACEEVLAETRRTHEALAQSLRQSDEQRLHIERSLTPIREHITALQLQEQQARLAAEQWARQLRDEGADRQAVHRTLAEADEATVCPAKLSAELERLSQAIERLGAVNLAAMDELQAAQEREGFLQAQHDDLLGAVQTLEEAITKIDRDTRARLQATFSEVNVHLAVLFPELFGGGDAKLIMTGDDLLDAGVQVMAQPPGKRNTTIQLLSGGEKALTAIALVFALFKLNPAPFCLLDEVDAPLDDANTERYVRLVSAMSAQTQFLFVSHNKIAMQMAQRLIGVTMQEQGVSRIVAVNMESALEMA